MIEVLYDCDYDCDQAGCSGGEEQGGRVYVDGEMIYELIPRAGCFDNNYYPEGHEVGLIDIALKHLGIDLEIIER